MALVTPPMCALLKAFPLICTPYFACTTLSVFNGSTLLLTVLSLVSSRPVISERPRPLFDDDVMVKKAGLQYILIHHSG